MKNGTVVPTPTAKGTFSENVTVVIPLEIGVDLSTLNYCGFITKETEAEDPPPPEIEMEGVEVYPLPEVTMVMELTCPAVNSAIAVAGIPHDSEGDPIVIVGGLVYPDP